MSKATSARDRQRPVIIVGAGLIGLTTAHELVRRGHQVRVLEALNDIGIGTSFANGGLLTPSMSSPWNSPSVARHLAESLTDPYSPMKLRLRAVPSLAMWGAKFLRNSAKSRFLATTIANYRLARYSLDATREIASQISFAFDGANSGTLNVFRNSDAIKEPLDLANTLAREGLRFELLDASGAVNIEPHLASFRKKITGALWYPDDGSGDAHLFCRALANRITAHGGLISLNVRVRSIRSSNGQVTGISTSDDDIESSDVIVAGGAYSGSLAKFGGIRSAVAPAKGYSVTFDVSQISDRPRVPVVDDAMHAALSPLGMRLRAVGTAEFAGFDLSLQRVRIENLTRLFAEIYPHLAEQVDIKAAQPWAGLRPMSADGLPFIGKTRLHGLWLNIGHSHLGWTMAAGSAKLLADQFEDKPTQVDVSAYLPTRR